MLVYRIEYRDGNGVWSAQTDEGGIVMYRDDTPCVGDHPAPFDDKRLRDASRNEDYFYGCDSIKQLERWFPLELRVFFKRFNFRVAVYETFKNEGLVVGETQVIFIKKTARLVGYLNMITLEQEQ